MVIQLPALDLDAFMMRRERSDSTSSGSSDENGGGRRPQNEKMILRGPWDHSSGLPLSVDVGSLIRPLEPAALGRN
jgi:hypothetical protein